MNKSTSKEYQDKEACCAVPKHGNMTDYWNEVFSSKEVQNWTEEGEPKVMKWVRALNLDKDAAIFCAGVGDSPLIDFLLADGFTNIIANDVSEIALRKIKKRIGTHPGISFMRDDLMNPHSINALYGKVDLYIDRATLHFFTTCKEKDFYFNQLNKLLASRGRVILGVFSKNNEPTCCGLSLQLWSLESLKNRLVGFEFLAEDTEDFKEQNGKIREYIYLNARVKA